VKREEMSSRIQYACLYLVFIGGAYLFSFTRLALCLLAMQYLVEAVFHACRSFRNSIFYKTFAGERIFLF
jgi:hypothetical protein